MTTTRSRLGRRLLAALSSGALAVGALALVATPAQAAPAAVPATTTGSGPSYVDDATFTWGVSGYAQKGIFGPWRFLNATGNATFLNGSTQTEYTAAPVPATSMPAAGGSVPANPNAVKLTAGSGVVDTTTGAGKLSWTGSYTTNAYPANLGAPDETYTDPVLTIAADGSGTLTAVFGLGAGVDQGGNPVDAASFGRLTIAEFAAGSLSNKTATGYRATPKYQGVTATLPADVSAQTTSCTAGSGATGWWGSWPQPFITAITGSPVGKSIAPHFYSTGCGGLQDNKPQLPVDVTYTAKPAPQVTVSNTRVNAAGTTVVTVSGTGFYAPQSVGTRPPLSGKNAGSYVVFGKFAESWRPSLGAASANRKQVNGNPALTKWAVPAADLATIGGPSAGGVELNADGTFTTTVTIDKATLDTSAGAGTDAFRYGIYTYGASGAIAPAYETYTPITFLPVASTTALDKAAYEGGVGDVVPVAVTVSGPNEPEKATGAVTLSVTPAGGSATQVDSDTLGADGTVTLQLPAGLTAGNGELTVSYAGDEIYGASTKTATYSIGKEAVTVSLDKPSYTGTTGTAVPVAVTVASAVGTPAGSVVLSYQPAGGTVTALPAATLDGAGKATVDLPATVGAGSGEISVAYSGSGTHLTGTGNATYTLTKKSSAITVAGPASVAYRTPATFTATVTNGSGDVRITGAGTTYLRPIVSGKATFVLPATLPAGARTLKFEYLGDGSTSAATAVSKAVTIAKGATTATARVTKKWTAARAGALTVAVASVKGGPVPVGKVAVTLKKGKVTKALSAKVLANGKVVLALPRSAKGSWAVKVTYLGSTQHAAATRTWTVKVPAK